MKSITQFWSDVNYRAIVSPNGRFVIKHSKEENYEGYDEMFLLYDSGELVREIVGENCLFIGNEYVLKFPFIGYSEECMDLVLFKLADNIKLKILYPESISNILCSRAAIYNQEDMNVYFFSNVQSEIKDYSKFIYCLDSNKLINSHVLDIYETTLNFQPNNTFLEIFNNSLICADKNDTVIQLNLPLTNNYQLNPFQSMNSFTIQTNEYLNINIQAYYRHDYTTYGTEGNPDFINHLKNQFGDTSVSTLQNAVNELIEVIKEDLPKIKSLHNTNLTVCVIPRAKAESHYSDNQKLFKRVIASVVEKLSGFTNGTSYVIRNINTKTTHMNRSGYGGDGDMPYVGITKATCKISSDVRGKDILLIDDIYTKGVNIDEDAIQALLDNGAKSVIFYAVAKTYKGGIKQVVRPQVINDDDDLPF